MYSKTGKINKLAVIQFLQFIHFSRFAVKIRLFCPLCLEKNLRDTKCYNSTAKLSQHLVKIHVNGYNDTDDAKKVELIKRSLDGLSLGIQMGFIKVIS